MNNKNEINPNHQNRQMQQNNNQSFYPQLRSKLCANLKKNLTAALLSSNLQTPSIKSDQSKKQLSSSSRMLQALNIKTNPVENYDKLRIKLKMQNFVNCNDYKIIITKRKVKICSIEDILLKELSKLETLILMGNSASIAVPKTNCDTKKYSAITLKLKYIKVLKRENKILG